LSKVKVVAPFDASAVSTLSLTESPNVIVGSFIVIEFEFTVVVVPLIFKFPLTTTSPPDAPPAGNRSITIVCPLASPEIVAPFILISPKSTVVDDVPKFTVVAAPNALIVVAVN